MVADDAVEDPARLLRVDEIQVDLALFGHRLLDGAPGDLVEGHAVKRGFRALFEHFGQVPCNRFPFAVGVGGEIDFVRGFGGGAQLLHDRFAARGVDVLRREVVFDIDPELALRQVADMPHRGDDGVIFPEHLPDGPGFGRRLDDQKFRHVIDKLLRQFRKFTLSPVRVCAHVYYYFTAARTGLSSRRRKK